MFTLTHWYGDTSPPPFEWLGRIASAVATFWSHVHRMRHAQLMSAEL
jgi:hypothetical protein